VVTIVTEEPVGKNAWIAPERIYLNAQGQVVKGNDPTKETLLVAAGGRISIDEARRYGLVKESQPAVGSDLTVSRPETIEAVTTVPVSKAERKHKK
jgi:hypothetical protein